MLKNLLISITFLISFNINAQEFSKSVDKFKIGKNLVEVSFYDPFQNILNSEPEFDGKSEKEKSELLNNYLHNSTLYEFKVTSKKTKETTNYKVVGNPEITKSKMFYKIDVYENQANSRTIEKVNCGGTLFEHMSLFDDPARKKYIGTGIQLFGYYRRVQPYSEIKYSMTAIIERDLAN